MEKQTPSELQNHFDEQLGFLGSSAERFDQGVSAEAKRLAHTVRVLCHNTARSHSLLAQLDKDSAPFARIAAPWVESNLMSICSLVCTAHEASGARYFAPLDEVPPPFNSTLPFQDWWTEPVLRDSERQVFSRRDLVLAVANKDGGSHIDPELHEEYARLSRKNSMQVFFADGEKWQSIASPHLEAVRQIAHEVLKTFVPNYAKSRHIGNASLISSGYSLTGDAPFEDVQIGGTIKTGAPLIVGSSMPGAIRTPVFRDRTQSVAKTGRNSRCSCGSGKKYKHCHGKSS